MRDAMTAICLRASRAMLVLAVLLAAAGVAWAQIDAAKRLAPRGELRVAVMALNPVLASRAVDGQFGGVSVDLANALGAKLGVSIRLVPYENLVHFNKSIGKDEWDIGFVPRDLSRTRELAFSDVFLEADNSYVARSGISLAAASEADRKGIRVAVAQGSPLDGFLTRKLTSAEIVRVPVGSVSAQEALSYGRADLYADSTDLAYRIAAELPGATVLVGRINTVPMSIAVPKENVAVLPMLNEFLAKAKKDGVIAGAIKRANLRGVRPPR